MLRADELAGPENERLGREVDARDLLDDYVDAPDGAGAVVQPAAARIVLDCANGSGGVVAPQILAAHRRRRRRRASTSPTASTSTSTAARPRPAALARDRWPRPSADIGFALDGDADRCVAIDERGEVVDGDQLIGIIALDRLARGALPEGIVVVSVLSNGGLESALVERRRTRRRGRRSATSTSSTGCSSWAPALGGEKSGHVIIREHANAGDGIVTALEVLSILARTGRPLSELAAQIPLYPQQQRTIPVRHKDQWEADPTFARAVDEARRELDGARPRARPAVGH